MNSKTRKIVGIVLFLNILFNNCHNCYSQDGKIIKAIKDNDINLAKGVLNSLNAKEKINNIDQEDDKGYTALMIAAKNGQLELVELLLKEGAKVNTINDNNDTALTQAAKAGHVKVVEFLIRKGSDIGPYLDYFERNDNKKIDSNIIKTIKKALVNYYKDDLIAHANRNIQAITDLPNVLMGIISEYSVFPDDEGILNSDDEGVLKRLNALQKKYPLPYKKNSLETCIIS